MWAWLSSLSIFRDRLESLEAYPASIEKPKVPLDKLAGFAKIPLACPMDLSASC